MSDAVDAMNLRAFVARYGDDGPGNQAFDPRMMVKVLLYAYASGTFSSRRIAAKLHEDVALRVLGAGNFPAHRTIADFRVHHLEEFQDLFVQVVEMAREAGLVKLGTVAIDGTKVRANASKRKEMTYGRMKSEENFVLVGKLQTDLIVEALACDLTRVASLQWSHPVSPTHLT